MGMGLNHAEKPAFEFYSILPDYDIVLQSDMIVEVYPKILIQNLFWELV